MKILVTGAAGYIGGTFAFEALKKGYKVFGLDNFSNSTDFVPSILSRKFKKNWVFTELDLVHHKSDFWRNDFITPTEAPTPSSHCLLKKAGKIVCSFQISLHITGTQSCLPLFKSF